MASTLADRFRALLKPGMLSTTELELVIGEAQQLYPEIWRHLDEARTALLEKGRDVSAFDELRMAELGHLGVTNVDATTQLDYVALMMGRIRIHTVKTATFNRAGYVRAVTACKALMNAMPEVDWVALIREEDREIAAAGSLHASKWSGSVKAIAIAVGLAGVAGAVYWVATRAPAEPIGGAPKRSAAVEAREAAASAARRADRSAKTARIEELRAKYQVRCDRSVLPALVQAMRDADRPTEAKHLEASECTPERPECGEVRDAISARLAQQLQLAQDTMELRCDGILVADGQKAEPAFAVTIDAGGKLLRGVVSLEGTKDLVAFGPTPSGARLMKLGDIDDDKLDELVFASERELFVTRIVAGAFVDVAGPVLKRGCQADITVERDFRTGTGDKQRLVLTSYGDTKGCPPEGEHIYTLRDGALVELN